MILHLVIAKIQSLIVKNNNFVCLSVVCLSFLLALDRRLEVSPRRVISVILRLGAVDDYTGTGMVRVVVRRLVVRWHNCKNVLIRIINMPYIHIRFKKQKAMIKCSIRYRLGTIQRRLALNPCTRMTRKTQGLSLRRTFINRA